jgi:thymidine kinase
MRASAQSISTLPDVPDNTEIIFIDEVQFFMEPYFHGDIVEAVRVWLSEGRQVVAAGLDMDWQGKPFVVTAKLLAMADNVIKTKANCTVCGHPAVKTYKKTPAGGSVELGSTDIYEARCNAHWHSVEEIGLDEETVAKLGRMREERGAFVDPGTSPSLEQVWDQSSDTDGY